MPCLVIKTTPGSNIESVIRAYEETHESEKVHSTSIPLYEFSKDSILLVAPEVKGVYWVLTKRQ